MTTKIIGATVVKTAHFPIDMLHDPDLTTVLRDMYVEMMAFVWTMGKQPAGVPVVTLGLTSPPRNQRATMLVVTMGQHTSEVSMVGTLMHYECPTPRCGIRVNGVAGAVVTHIQRGQHVKREHLDRVPPPKTSTPRSRQPKE